MHVRIPTGSLKFAIGWTAVFLFRLIPFRPPNFEPMLATVMPFSKRYGFLGSFAFGFLGIVAFDAITSGWGSWTWVTAICYGLVGVAAHAFFRNRDASVKNFLVFGIPATLVYDGITLWIGPIFEGQAVALALAGQIPFTMMHLASTVTFSVLLSPAIYRWVVQNDYLEIVFTPAKAVAAPTD